MSSSISIPLTFLRKTRSMEISHNRLRCVFRTVYSFISLFKKVVANNARVSRSLSYIAIDIQSVNGYSRDEHKLFDDVDPNTLADVVRDKDFDGLCRFGGVEHVAAVLGSDRETGISSGNEEKMKERISVFGSNTFQKLPAKSFLSFVREAFRDSTIIILLACAVLSLGFGVKEQGLKEGWYDGGSIIVAVFLVVVVSSVSDFNQSRQFEKIWDKNSDMKLVEVVRDGTHRQISVSEVAVGDIVCLKTGDRIPADGLFLDGHSLKMDESSMTGENDHVAIGESNPFLLSGTKVMDGYGKMLVTSVGMNTGWGQMMSLVARDLHEQTPLQARLDNLTSCIGKIGLLVALIVLAILLVRYFTGNTKDENGHQEFKGSSSQTKPEDVMNALVRIVAAAITIVVVAIPEGLPLAVTLTLAYSMKRMMTDNAMVRKLSACETMGSVTTICTDKTGTITLNKMKVTEFWLGKKAINQQPLSEIAPSVLELLQQGAGLNTSGEIHTPQAAAAAVTSSSPLPEVSGSPTESAILNWAVLDIGMDMDKLRQNHEILHVESFNSEKKRSGILVKRNQSNNNNNTLFVHWKGAAEMILAMCSHYNARSGKILDMDEEDRAQFETIIKNMADKSFRCIAFAYKQVTIEDQQRHVDKLEETGLTMLGLAGLKDPCRTGVKEAVEACTNAGINVKMITGDNMFTAKSIAIECGILKPDEEAFNNAAVVEGVTFRNYTAEERIEKIDKIRVMARSSPFDKLLMVQCLKQKGHVVAVTGDGTNDALALKEADIGLSMGIQGTDVAKESSDIIILDDNFTSIETIVRWGRCVYNNIQKFIQFQLTVNVTALIINFVAALSSGEVPLTAVQLLWVNLIMDTLGALALATEKPTNDLMAKKPVGRSEPLITKVMWRNLIAQAFYQVIVLLTLHFEGSSIFGVNKKVKDTLVFNTFVFCQIFNEFNARKLEQKNIFRGMLKNNMFLGIVGMTIVLQIVMVEFLNKFATTERLNKEQWTACIGIAALSWPIGCLVKCIPMSKDQLLVSCSERNCTS